MRLKIILLALFMSFVLAGCGDDSPEAKLSSINELLAKNIPMNAEQKSDIDKFVGEGKRLLAEGKSEESSLALDSAYKVLKHAEDAAMFNKSE